MRLLRPTLLLATLLYGATGEALAQGLGSPSRLAEIESSRSRDCVRILERLEAVDARLAPFAQRVERLQAIASAIAIEDPSVVQPLDTDDPTEARVAEWFASDQALARRYVTQQDASVLAERTAGRETIKATVTRALEAVQEEANQVLGEDEAVINEAAPCDGAIFVRPAVLEACADAGGALCEDARLPATEPARFRFVDDAAAMWEMEEVRPWTQPAPIRPGPGGLTGGRTVGFTRVGNVVATVAFTAIILPREQIPEETLAAYEATNTALGVTFQHPTIAFTPALGVRLALPQPLDAENGYVLHFGSPDQAEVVWAGDAGTGRPLEGTVPLTAGQVQRLAAGDRLTLTAIANAEPVPDAVYAIRIGNVTQAQNTQALLGYMQSQLGEDLAQIVPPSGTE